MVIYINANNPTQMVCIKSEGFLEKVKVIDGLSR